MSSKSENIIKDTDAKVILVSTFVKSFNSMPKWLRWGTIIAVILGVFYFGIIQKYAKEPKETIQIEMIQSSVTELSLKLRTIELNQKNSLEIYEEVEEIQKIFNVFAEAERKKVKAFINFLRNTHGRNFDRAAYENAINKFENEDYRLQKEYQDKVEEIFQDRLRKHLRQPSQTDDLQE